MNYYIILDTSKFKTHISPNYFQYSYLLCTISYMVEYLAFLEIKTIFHLFPWILLDPQGLDPLSAISFILAYSSGSGDSIANFVDRET